MLRLVDIALWGMPVALIVLWLVLAFSGGPSRLTLAVAAAGLLLGVGVLYWTAEQDHLTRHDRYVPARVEDGRVVGGHAAGQ